MATYKEGLNGKVLDLTTADELVMHYRSIGCRDLLQVLKVGEIRTDGGLDSAEVGKRKL